MTCVSQMVRWLIVCATRCPYTMALSNETFAFARVAPGRDGAVAVVALNCSGSAAAVRAVCSSLTLDC